MAASMIPYGPPAFDVVAAAVRNLFAGFLDPNPPRGVPKAQVVLVGMTERSAGLGRYTGAETRGSFGVSVIKAVRVEALVRLAVWAADPDQAAKAVTDLTGRLLHGQDALRANGVLRVELVGSSPVERVEAAAAWRTDTDCRVLYEQPYRDADGAESLIAGIPVTSDLGQRGSARTETTVVTDEMARWDNVTAAALVV